MSGPRTVLHLIDTGGPGGAETVFANLVTGLQPFGWSGVAVVPARDWLWNELERHGIKPLYWPSSGAFDLRYLRGLASIARRYHADLIQTHLFTSAVYGTIAGRLNKLPVVCTHHGQTDITTSGSYRKIKFSIVRRRLNHHVFVSNDLKQRFAAGGIINGHNSHVIQNGIDCDAFRPDRDDAFREELGLHGDVILVGAVGNLRPPKDYPTFIRAARKLAERSANYYFVIAGADDEPVRGELLRLIHELGLEGRFRLLGFRADVARVLNSLDVYVLSSSTEGFSLTTVQAMACGLPVVATKCGGPEEVVVDGETGVLVAPRSPIELADAIDSLAADQARRVAFGAAGRARALLSFSIESMISAYAALYQECAPARKSDRRN